MTLFWHNHFATSNAKVNNAGLMQRQNDLLRTHALGDFPALLAAIGKDPAMLIWLDSTANRKAHPNENYAREVMELFTLGRGHYTEKDIQEAARAFTGWFVSPRPVSRDRRPARRRRARRSSANRPVRRRRHPGDPARPARVRRVPLRQARSAHFVSEIDPVPPALIAPLAEAFRESGYEIRVPLAMILRSNLFFDPAVRRRRVKCPVEFAVGTIRALEVLKPTVAADALAEACVRMGQSLYAPPSVAGWDGGAAWINSTTMLTRTNLVLALLSDDDDGLGGRLRSRRPGPQHGFRRPEQGAGSSSTCSSRTASTPRVREPMLRPRCEGQRSRGGTA